MNSVILNVDGMSCSHCEECIKNSLEKLNGVKEVFVDLKGKTVSLKFENILLDEIKQTIEEQGYDVI